MKKLQKKLNPASEAGLLKLQQVMNIGNYSVRSIGNYVREMRFIFEYYPDLSPVNLTAEQVEIYICYIKKTFNSGFSKCRLVASSVSFYFKQILKRPYDLPSKLYPRRPFQLPNVMTADEVRQLLSTSINLKQQAILQLFYSSGMRLEECSRLKIADIDSKNMRIKVVQGKGNKDRYTLLSRLHRVRSTWSRTKSPDTL